MQLMYLRNWMNWMLNWMTLQEKKLFEHEMWKHVKSSETKVSLFAKQASESNFCHFFLLGKQKVPTKCLKVFLLRLRIICRIWRSQEDFRILRKLSLNSIYSFIPSLLILKTPELELIDMQLYYTVKEMLCLLQVFVWKIFMYREICWENVFYI